MGQSCMTYAEAIAFWFGRINYEVRAAADKDLKLERMRALLRLLGDPQDRLRIVHVTGTKGKGSTCAMLASILQEAGYRVGLFTSPHLERVEERIQVNRELISESELARLMTDLVPLIAELDAGPWPPPTFFEISTALAFLHFVRRRCELVVLEVGLGGRFDSTNVCHPLLAVITTIGFDHMAQLGNTLEAIAYQKAGIIKPRVPVISGVTESGPRNVIAQVAQSQHSELIEIERDFQYAYSFKPQPHVTVQWGQESSAYSLSLLGAHQAGNAAIAVATVDRLRRSGLNIPEAAVRTGLAKVRWPARIEWIGQNPQVILDSAHNVPSAEALVATLQETFPDVRARRLIFAVSNDKQYAEMLAVLVPFFDVFYLTKYGNNPRCVAPERLEQIVRHLAGDKSIAVLPTAAEAWAAARNQAQPEDLVCITGSVFLAGELQQLVRQVTS